MGDVIKATVNFLNALHLSIVIILLYIYLFFHLPMNISVNNLPGVLLLSIRTPIAFAAFVREHRTRRLLRACRPPPPRSFPSFSSSFRLPVLVLPLLPSFPRSVSTSSSPFSGDIYVPLMQHPFEQYLQHEFVSVLLSDVNPRQESQHDIYPR